RATTPPNLRGVQTTRAMRSAGDDQVYRFRPFALFVGLDVKTDPLSFVQTLQSGLLYCGDMNEYVAAAVVRFDEAVASFAVKELHNTRCAIGNLPNCFAAGPTHGGSARHSQTGKASAKGLSHSAGPHRRRNVTANLELHTNWKPVERGTDIKASRG